MNKLFLFLTIFTFALAITFSSCKRGQSILAVGHADTAAFPVPDTFNGPTSKYYFYGKCDGNYKMWQNEERSAWDTVKRFGTEDKYWDNDEYLDNIYFNFTEMEDLGECGPDSQSNFLVSRSYFIRPGDPYERLEVYFYDCVNLTDTNNINWPNNPLSVFLNGANPFSSPAYGRNGVKVVYVDKDLERWETKAGSGQLLDTYFRVTDFYENDTIANPLDTFALYIVEGEFAGRLYNGDKEKTVLDAKFRMRVIPREFFLP